MLLLDLYVYLSCNIIQSRIYTRYQNWKGPKQSHATYSVILHMVTMKHGCCVSRLGSSLCWILRFHFFQNTEILAWDCTSPALNWHVLRWSHVLVLQYIILYMISLIRDSSSDQTSNCQSAINSSQRLTPLDAMSHSRSSMWDSWKEFASLLFNPDLTNRTHRVPLGDSIIWIVTSKSEMVENIICTTNIADHCEAIRKFIEWWQENFVISVACYQSLSQMGNVQYFSYLVSFLLSFLLFPLRFCFSIPVWHTFSSGSLSAGPDVNCCNLASPRLKRRVMSCVRTSIWASLLSESSKLVKAARPCNFLSSDIFCLIVNISARICSLKST